MEEIMPGIILAIIFFGVIVLVKILSDNKLRHKLIDQGAVDENIKYLYQNNMETMVPSSLKWGLVFIGVGLAFLIGQLVPQNMSGEVTVGAIFVMAGLGLLVYYFIGRRMMKRGQ